MDAILIQQNEHWSGTPYEIALERIGFQALIPKIAIEEILILLGIRRSGKSTLFKMIINHLLDKQIDPNKILYVNFDDPFFTDLYDDAKKLYSIVETAEKIKNTKIEYLFLDEIQNVEAWERFVKSVYDSQVFKKIFITGSNSSLLTSQYATLLTGRYLQQRIYPLRFSEMALAKGIESYATLISQKPTMLRLTEQCLESGCYPRVYLSDNSAIKRDLLISYFDAILYKDCIQMHNIRDTKRFVELTHYLISNAGSSFSYSKLASVFGCSDNTIKEFIGILEKSYLLHQLNQFSFSLKKQEKGNRKIYVADNGFIYANAFQFFDPKGPLFENLVLNELQKQFGDKIFFYHDQYECDFIVQTEEGFLGIQVCFKLTEQNRVRECRGLSHADEKIHFYKKIILTFDQEEQIEDVEVIPFWKYFSGHTLDKH